jgi:hypothetical protein
MCIATAIISVAESQNRLPLYKKSQHSSQHTNSTHGNKEFDLSDPLKNLEDTMESDNLKTASLYINNQLLSRGLLRNGQNIDFARPDKGEGGMEATMGRIMGVVNDLILRRDVRALQPPPTARAYLTLSSATPRSARVSRKRSARCAQILCGRRRIWSACKRSTPRRSGNSGSRRRRSGR